jgi:hypothetical protein
VTTLVVALSIALATSACDARTPRTRNEPGYTPPADRRRFATAAAFAEDYWQRPVPYQGPRDSTLPSLAPSVCGACHPRQFLDWQTTVHAGAYSPGLAGQLVEWERADYATVRQCLQCHAPLTEQSAWVDGDGGSDLRPNATFDRSLQHQGLVCAACHVRGGVVHGPPMRDGALTAALPGAPHRGSTRAEYFEDVAFCAGCHQFDQPSANGKSLQNTVTEWSASRYARDGETCQRCHMPDRRHLWRGIHDSAMVRNGVTITLRRDAPGRVALQLKNSGVGHAFPTYVTPSVMLRLDQRDAAGHSIPGAGASQRIGRSVRGTESGWVEDADTRVLPDSAATLHLRLHPAARQVVAQVDVFPDAFYDALFASLLGERRSDSSRTLLEGARARSRSSHFRIFQDSLAVSENH